MRALSILLCSILLVNVGLGQNKVLLPATLNGHWEGTGRFLNTKFDRKMGHLPIEANIQDGAAKGTIGSSHWHSVNVVKLKPDNSHARRSKSSLGYQIIAVLDSPITASESGGRRWLLLLISGTQTTNTLDVDFHLKHKFGFDPTIRVGNVQLNKK